MAYNHYEPQRPWEAHKTPFTPENANNMDAGIEGNEQNINIINYSLAQEWQPERFYLEFDLIQYNGLFYWCSLDMREWCEDRGIDPIEWLEEHDTFESQEGFWNETEYGDIGWIASTAIRNARKALDENRATQKSLEVTNRSLDALWKLNEGQTYEWETDATPTRTKTVPSGAVTGSIAVLGGMSRKGKNLAEVLGQTFTSNGLAFTRSADGGITINGTATSDTNYRYDQPNNGNTNTKTYQAGTYTLSIQDSNGNVLTDRSKIDYASLMQDSTWITPIKAELSKTSTIQTYANCFLLVRIKSGASFNNETFYPMFELSSTPTPYEPYTDKLIDAKVDKVECYGKNLLNPATCVSGILVNGIPQSSQSWQRGYITSDFIKVEKNKTYSYSSNQTVIPSKSVRTSLYDANKNPILNANDGNSYTVTVDAKYMRVSFGTGEEMTPEQFFALYHQQIELGSTATPYEPYNETDNPIPPQVIAKCADYGIGINENCYNWLDMEEKKYHRRVASVDMGSLSWKYDSTNAYFGTSVVGGMPNIGLSKYYTMICAKDYTLSYSRYANGYATAPDKIYAWSRDTSGVNVKDLAYTDPTAFKTAMQGVMLYYELETEEVIELADVWVEGMELLEVESGGTIAFHYPQLDEGYEVDMPNTEIYAIKLQEVR